MDEKNETGPAVEPKQEQQCKQARPHDELICELLDSRRPKTEREHAAVREIERLRAELASWQEAFGLLTTLHGSIQIDSSDPMGMAKQIESHVRATIPRLRVELTEARKPDCRLCNHFCDMVRECLRWDNPASCVEGKDYSPDCPVRLYEKEGEV